MARPSFDWSLPYLDHLRWLWAVLPELPKQEIATRIGVSLETLKHKQAAMGLSPRQHGRKTFYSAGRPFHVDRCEDGPPIANCAEERRLNENAYLGSDRLLTRLRLHHDISEVVTINIAAQKKESQPWAS